MRPRRIVVVTGTGTEVGKTWVAARLASAIRAQRLTVAVRKPAQSFAAGDDMTDAHVLGAASSEAPELVCPPHRWYPVPMAPPMAAAELGLEPPSLEDLIAEVDRSWPASDVDLGIVEAAGGVASPQAADGDATDLARALKADRVLLVADAVLGTINAVRLSVWALAPIPVTVFLNRYDGSDGLHRANRDWLRVRDGFEVIASVDQLVV